MKEIAHIRFVSDKLNLEDFVVHFVDRDHDFAFEVYAVTNRGDEFSYVDARGDQQNNLEEFDEYLALKKLEGMFRWRGVWDNRVYFPDDEYLSEDFIKLSELYIEHITPYCKEYIKNKEPEWDYDNE